MPWDAAHLTRCLFIASILATMSPVDGGASATTAKIRKLSRRAGTGCPEDGRGGPQGYLDCEPLTIGGPSGTDWRRPMVNLRALDSNRG